MTQKGEDDGANRQGAMIGAMCLAIDQPAVGTAHCVLLFPSRFGRAEHQLVARSARNGPGAAGRSVTKRRRCTCITDREVSRTWL